MRTIVRKYGGETKEETKKAGVEQQRQSEVGRARIPE